MRDLLFIDRHNHFYHKYAEGLGHNPFSRGRYAGFQIMLNLFLQRHWEEGVIVETGCQRELEDWGGGCSTYIFSEFLSNYCNPRAHLYSIDNNKEHIDRAIGFTEEFKERITFIESDSVEGLKTINKKADLPGGRIDLLYLDSFDYPYGELLDLYGGKEDIDQAILRVDALTDDEIVKLHSDVILPCQEHCLNELLAAVDVMSWEGIIAIGDNALPGGGKPRLAKEWLLGHSGDWELLLDSRQSIWLAK